MMPEPIETFFHDFRQEVMADAEANSEFAEAEFTQKFADELTGAGIVDGFEPCHYRAATGGTRVDGYWLNDDALDIFITDFANNEELRSLTQTDVNAILRRAENFFLSSAEKNLYTSLEETSPGYGLAHLISDRHNTISRVAFYLISERVLSERVQAVESRTHRQVTFTYNVWDISRLHRLFTSRGSREELHIDFSDVAGGGIPCLPAHLSSTTYGSYLVVMPGTILADLYSQYGSRLLEQNVRSFLQARGNVNKGIRATIIQDPEMFFAYNNGITATAREIETDVTDSGLVIRSLTDLQIVNGGQTTASLYHTQRKDNASLDRIFVQMKLTIIDDEKGEDVVPRISEYANTQNKVNAADFFSNHPFHIRLEEFSRRLWAPATQGAQRETKWFYERARGQYADERGKRTPAERKRFEAEYPKAQMFTKTDIAKFDGVWDDNPTWVNMGAQKNFAHYAGHIGKEWEAAETHFNEWYFKRLVARAILFRTTEKIVSRQSWYNGGYRANIVAYTLALISRVCSARSQFFDFIAVWNRQSLSPSTITAIERVSEIVHADIMNPGGNISNVSEWCKREACWQRLQTHIDDAMNCIPAEFFDDLMSSDDVQDLARSAVKSQKLLNGIEAQRRVLEIQPEIWLHIMDEGKKLKLFSPKEIDILQIATQIPNKIPSEKQAAVLLDILDKAKIEAIWYEKTD